MKTIEVSEQKAIEIEKKARDFAANELLTAINKSTTDEQFSENLRQLRINCVCLLAREAVAYVNSEHGTVEEYLKELNEYIMLEFNLVAAIRKERFN